MRIKITGINKNGNIEVAYTEVNKYNLKQIFKDINTIIRIP